MNTESRKIKVFDYTNYRQFLRDYYDERKGENRNFSYRSFSQKAGIKSVGYYKDVVEGRRDLGRTMILKFTKALGLSQKEAEYFESMVYFNEVKTIRDREFYFVKMMSNHESKAYKVHSSQYDYYSKWYYSAIMALLSYTRFTGDTQAVGKILNPSVKSDHVKKTIDLLLQLGIVEVNKKGEYELVHQSLTVSVGEEERIQGLNIIKYQKTMLEMAGEAYDINSLSDLDMSTLTLSISESTYKEFKKELSTLRNKFVHMAKRDEKPDRVYQLNCNLFPLTRIEKVKE